MWRLFNRLFGWEYVYIENSAASHIKRCFIAPNGELMVNAYSFQIWSLCDGTVYNNTLFCRGWSVKGLTIGVSDYINKEIVAKGCVNNIVELQLSNNA